MMQGASSPYLRSLQERVSTFRRQLAGITDPEALSLARSILSELSQALDHLATGEAERAEALRSSIQAGATLQQREEYFEALFENSSDIITILDADGIIRFESPSIERELGYTPSEVTGRSAFDFVHPEDLAAVQRAFQQCLATPRTPIAIEVRFLHKSGDWHVLEALGNNLLDNAVVQGLVVTSRDVTDRRLMEEALRESEERLRHAQKMEAVGRLAGGVAHDFNNLLTVIKSTIQLLLRDVDATSPLRADLEEIDHTADRAAALTRQLLTFSRKQVLQPQVVQLERVVADTVSMLRRLVGEDIELITRIKGDAGCVSADPGHLEQLLVNLAVNARDAMPEGGRLAVEVRSGVMPPQAQEQSPEAAPGSPAVVLIVSDTGIGMDRETRERIFEPFFTTKEQGKGTGLGLSTVYGIVRQAGGYVWVYSEPGQGSTFKIYLRRIDLPEGAVRAEDSLPAEPATGSAMILLVEDDPAVRSTVCRILERAGYSVLEAASAAEALDITAERTGAIDLLLTDVVLPGSSGSRLADQLTARSPGLRVLFMSGYAAEAIGQQGMLAPGAAFIEKPFAPEELLRRVRGVLGAAG